MSTCKQITTSARRNTHIRTHARTNVHRVLSMLSRRERHCIHSNLCQQLDMTWHFNMRRTNDGTSKQTTWTLIGYLQHRDSR